MKTTVLVVTLMGAAFTAGKDVKGLITALKAIHHHTTKPVYTHVIKPIEKKLTH